MLLKRNSRAWTYRAVKKDIPATPIATDLDDDDAPDVTQISDDSSVDSSRFSCDSESEGGIWDNTNNNDVLFAPEEGNQNVIPPDDEGIRATMVGLPIGCRDEGVNQPPKNVPDPNLAPEGARSNAPTLVCRHHQIAASGRDP